MPRARCVHTVAPFVSYEGFLAALLLCANDVVSLYLFLMDDG